MELAWWFQQLAFLRNAIAHGGEIDPERYLERRLPFAGWSYRRPFVAGTRADQQRALAPGLAFGGEDVEVQQGDRHRGRDVEGWPPLAAGGTTLAP